MFRTAAMLVCVTAFALPAIAQNKEPGLPENTIDCKQFQKTGPQQWIEVGTAVFDLGHTKDINLTNQPVTPRYFRFGGFDLYTVVEQKCGAAADPNAASAPAPASVTLDQATVSKTELEQDKQAAAQKPKAEQDKQAAAPKPGLEQNKSASAPVQMPVQTNIEPVPVLEIVKSQAESTSCGDKNSVYVADGLAGAEGGGGLIEIVFNKEITASNTDFIIREFRKNKFEWTYKGKKTQEHFIFAPASYKQERNVSRFAFMQVHFSREKPVMLALNYVKPNRNGTGEAILYLSGLRALFASKENARRFKFEGNRPSELLPEAFYFDRCE